MSSKQACCGQGSAESMVSKFNEMKSSVGKTHPHQTLTQMPAMTTQTTFTQPAFTPQFTSGGFLKYVRGNFGQK
jgi:hypothetical protein